MRTDDVRYVLEVAKQENLTAAASVLHVAPPTLSEAVKRVEAELATNLFDRTNRGMTLTSRGHQLIAQLVSVVEAEDRLRRAAKRSDKPTQLRIGCPQGAWHRAVAKAGDLLPPGITTTTISTDIFYPIDSLFDDAIDFALLPAPSDHDGVLKRLPMFTEERNVAISASAPIASSASARLEELDEYPWMGRPSDSDRAYTSTHRCDDIRGGPPKRLGPYHSNPLDIGQAVAVGEVIVAGTMSISNMFNLKARGVTSLLVDDSPPWQVDLVALKEPRSRIAICLDELATAFVSAIECDPLLSPI